MMGLLGAQAALAVGFPGRARGEHWGGLPAGILPSGYAPKKVLEIFLYGALSPWETFYFRPSTMGFAAFDAEFNSVVWRSGIPHRPVSTDESVPLIEDIRLGPATKPLWDLRSKLRLVVLAHDLPPHEAAIPLALAGRRLGDPRQAGMAAVVNRKRHRSDNLPSAYVYVPGALPAVDNVSTALFTGFLGAEHRPLPVPITPSFSEFVSHFRRPKVRAPMKNLLASYRKQGEDLMRYQGAIVRSKVVGEYGAALDALGRAPELHDTFKALADNDFDPTPVAPYATHLNNGVLHPSGGEPMFNAPGNAIRQAARLLSQSGLGVDYACVIDGGLHYSLGGGGYDTHFADHTAITSSNTFNTLLALRQAIDRHPGFLDNTLVFINTEFGRGPFAEGDGRDHWERGYVVAMLGGGLPQGVAGRIDANGVAVEGTGYGNPTDVRAAVMLAALIHPFAADNLDREHLSSSYRAGNDDDTLRRIAQKILGL